MWFNETFVVVLSYYNDPLVILHRIVFQALVQKPNAAGLAESGTGITTSASVIGYFFARN